MSHPVVVEVTRGGRVESRHAGRLSVRDADGGTVLALGDVAAAVFPRSAVKAIQALPLLESGAADKLGLSPQEIALACASHAGEPEHVATALAMLRKAGREADALECGAHWPTRESAARALAARGGRPSALHNNCSGKHAGFVCLACGTGHEPQGYIGADHFVQREGRAAIEGMCGVALADGSFGIDGCSIPTWPVPLEALALAFARFGTGRGLGAKRAAAARTIRESVAAHPFMVAGTGRFDTQVMKVLGARAFTKGGAEGVFCASLPEQGLGIALKIDDGGARAAEAAMMAAIARLLPLSERERDQLGEWLAPRLVNWNGIEVGRLRVELPGLPAVDGAASRSAIERTLP